MTPVELLRRALAFYVKAGREGVVIGDHDPSDGLFEFFEANNLPREWGDYDERMQEWAMQSALREAPDPDAALDTLAAEAQEAGEYDDVGDWREYANKTDDLYIRRIASGRYRGSDVNRAFTWPHTPQGNDFWRRVALAIATPAEEARARDFAQRVLEAMEEER